MSHIKVRRKGQMTLPVGIRQKLRIEEGSLLDVREHKDGVLLTPAEPLEGGEVVGEASHKKILQELDKLRKKWR